MSFTTPEGTVVEFKERKRTFPTLYGCNDCGDVHFRLYCEGNVVCATCEAEQALTVTEDK